MLIHDKIILDFYRVVINVCKPFPSEGGKKQHHILVLFFFLLVFIYQTSVVDLQVHLVCSSSFLCEVTMSSIIDNLLVRQFENCKAVWTTVSVLVQNMNCLLLLSPLPWVLLSGSVRQADLLVAALTQLSPAPSEGRRSRQQSRKDVWVGKMWMLFMCLHTANAVFTCFFNLMVASGSLWEGIFPWRKEGLFFCNSCNNSEISGCCRDCLTNSLSSTHLFNLDCVSVPGLA